MSILFKNTVARYYQLSVFCIRPVSACSETMDKSIKPLHEMKRQVYTTKTTPIASKATFFSKQYR